MVLNSQVIERNNSSSSESQLEKPKLVHRENVLIAQKPTENIDNLLLQFTEEEVMNMSGDYAFQNGLEADVELFKKGGAIARDPEGFESMAFLSEEEKQSLRDEIAHKWRLSKDLWILVILCSMGAAVQGMDETVINGANLFYPEDLGLSEDNSRNNWLKGLVNSGPYLCCGCISCFLADPLNKLFGRRGTIFISSLICALTCFWQAFPSIWWHTFIARFFLGVGIGPNSATIPVYAAECTPARIRGALVMMWQMWTAFGIMIGYVSSLIFYHVKDTKHIHGLNWRLMLASALLPAVIVCSMVFTCPESPRWLIGKNRHTDAFKSMKRLKNSELIAARDTFYSYILLEQEEALKKGKNRIWEMFTITRNRNAAIATWILMFGQQFCGINVIAYYSSSIFVDSGFGEIEALIASWGFGMVNWLFALPAVFTIDKFGRRKLLLSTFPFMGIFLLIAGFAFWIPESNKSARVGVIAFGIYAFSAFYSCGEGPVPFTYSAEAFPLYIRDLGMGWATATCWFFNFILSVTWPSLLAAFKPQGAFGWYAAWNFVLFFLVLCFVQETKNLTLEELDTVFSVPVYLHASYQLKHMILLGRKNVLRQEVQFPPPLYANNKFGLIERESKSMAEGIGAKA